MSITARGFIAKLSPKVWASMNVVRRSSSHFDTSVFLLSFRHEVSATENAAKHINILRTKTIMLIFISGCKHTFLFFSFLIYLQKISHIESFGLFQIYHRGNLIPYYIHCKSLCSGGSAYFIRSRKPAASQDFYWNRGEKQICFLTYSITNRQIFITRKDKNLKIFFLASPAPQNNISPSFSTKNTIFAF